MSELSKLVDVRRIFDIPEDKMPLGRHLTAFYALATGKAFNMSWLDSKPVHDFISNLVLEEDFDAVHVDTISLAVYFKHFSNITTVLNHHNFESGMLEQRASSERNVVKRWYYRTEARRLLKSEIVYCRKASLNIACSDEDSIEMSEKAAVNNFITVPNGVDVDYFFPDSGAPISEKTIVLVGGLSWYPNREAVEYFIKDIWPLLKEAVPGLRVDIVGRNPTRAIIEASEQESAINVHGFVDDVRVYLWRSSLYLCPIRTGGGTKLKILDALASGCCIVADPFACKGINVKNGRHVFYAETPEQYVSKIKFLLANPEVQAAARQEGPRLIRESYNYEAIGSKYSKSLSDLLNNRALKSGTVNAGNRKTNSIEG